MIDTVSLFDEAFMLGSVIKGTPVGMFFYHLPRIVDLL
jgi:hypothetical protein